MRALIPIMGDDHRAIREKIIEYIRQGSHPAVACEAAGLSYKTFQKYIKVANGTETQWSPSPQIVKIIEEFVDAVRQAEAENEVEIVSFVKQEAMQDADTALKYLSRRYSHRWSEKSQNTSINITWQVQAAQMIQRGDITWDALEEEFGKAIVDNEIRPLLPEPTSRPAPLSDSASETIIESPAGITPPSENINAE